MKRLLIPAIWLPVALATLFVTLFLYSHYSYALSTEKGNEDTNQQQSKYYKMYVSHPQTLGASTASIEGEDAVPELVYQYLKKYKSPMMESAYNFAEIFRKYGIDPIVPLAIAQCESNLGSKMPPDCHNPFGLGIHSEGTLCFGTWEEGYEKMGKTLKEKYVEKGFITVEEVMAKYCPLSLEKGGSWSKCVNQFIGEIEEMESAQE